MGLLRASIDGNSTRGFARACAECGAGETRLRARNPEHRRKEHGCRRRDLSSRRQSASPSPCPVGIHLRSRAVRRHSQPDQALRFPPVPNNICYSPGRLDAIPSARIRSGGYNMIAASTSLTMCRTLAGIVVLPISGLRTPTSLIPDQSHETFVLMVLVVAVEERRAGVIGDKINFRCGEARHVQRVLHHP
jgi:hypothetical protein